VRISSVICFAVILIGSIGMAAMNEERPNILILYADDLGYSDLSCQSSDAKIPTPNLDRLAMEGMRFTDGHSFLVFVLLAGMLC